MPVSLKTDKIKPYYEDKGYTLPDKPASSQPYGQTPLDDILPGIKRGLGKVSDAYKNYGQQRVENYGGGGPLPGAAPVQQPGVQMGRPEPVMGNEPMQLPPTVNAPGYTSPEQVQQLREQKLEGTLPATQAQLNEGPSNQNQGYQRLGIEPGQEIGNENINQQYGNLNNSDVNQQRFQRNMMDAQMQDKASQGMVNRLNRGTQAMQELSNMRSGGGPSISGMENQMTKRLGPKTYGDKPIDFMERKYDQKQQQLDQQAQRGQQLPGKQPYVAPPVTSGNGLSASDQIARDKLTQEGNLARQKQMNDSAKFDANIENQIGGILSKPGFRKSLQAIENAPDENRRAYEHERFLSEYGLPYDTIRDYMQTKTNPNYDPMFNDNAKG